MNLLAPLFARIDAYVATANPFTLDALIAAVTLFLAVLFFAYSVRRLMASVDPPVNVVEARRDEELHALLSRAHQPPAPLPTLSGPAAKFLGATKDDRVVDERSAAWRVH